MSDTQAFPERLQTARHERGMSQERLGHMVDIASGTISKYERGDLKPSMENAARMAAALRVTMDWLVSGIGTNPFAHPPTVTTSDAAGRGQS